MFQTTARHQFSATHARLSLGDATVQNESCTQLASALFTRRLLYAADRAFAFFVTAAQLLTLAESICLKNLPNAEEKQPVFTGDSIVEKQNGRLIPSHPQATAIGGLTISKVQILPAITYRAGIEEGSNAQGETLLAYPRFSNPCPDFHVGKPKRSC